MSAQETTPKQACSTRALMRSITSKPRRLVFGPASFSALLPLVESISTDASHPSCCTMISAAGHALS
uniref:Uncharacterized protein n=1 Tax=Arundo donax TaxID=35708 RepID=A0A0A9GDZ2_ARUDO